MSTPKPNPLPVWMALLALPLVMFAERVAFHQASGHLFNLFTNTDLRDASGILEQAPTVEIAGMAIAALAVLVVGPHLTAGISLGAVIGGAALMVGAEVPLAHHLLVFGHGAATVAVVATAGASAGGATPALRYAILFATYAALLVGTETAPHTSLVTEWSGVTVGAVGLITLLVPTLAWWLNRRPMRQPTEGATGRTFLATLGLFCVLLCAEAAFSLLDPAFAATQSGWQAMVYPATQIVVALGLAGVLAIAQFAKSTARMGTLGGAGAMMIALAATMGWAWSDAAPALLLVGVASIGEVFLVPWAWARATSDAHWRVTGLLAFLVCLPYALSQEVDMLVAVGAAMTLSVAAIPIGALGWMADEWIFGDVLGPTDARGRH